MSLYSIRSAVAAGRMCEVDALEVDMCFCACREHVLASPDSRNFDLSLVVNQL